MAEIRIDNLSKSYARGRVALDGVALEVRSGEFLAIVGPSGGGKTTLLRVLAGLEKPDSGIITIAGQEMGLIRPAQRNIAMVFQAGGLYPHLSVRGNVDFPLRMQQLSESTREARIAHAVRMVEIEHRLDDLPATLSGGEVQRAALAKLIARQPTCGLLDEPLSHLDTRLRSRLCDVLKRVHAQTGMTMVHVTHDQDEAIDLGDRVAILAFGRVQQVATGTELAEQPANRFVLEFMARSTPHFREGHIARRNGQTVFETGDDTIPLGDMYQAIRPQAAVLACDAEDGRILHLFEPGPFGARLQSGR